MDYKYITYNLLSWSSGRRSNASESVTDSRTLGVVPTTRIALPEPEKPMRLRSRVLKHLF